MLKKLVIPILVLLCAAQSAVGHNYPQRIQSANADSLRLIVADLGCADAASEPRLNYWKAYAVYNQSLMLKSEGAEKEAKDKLMEAVGVMEELPVRSAEDNALLAMMYNYSISFAGMMQARSISGKVKKTADAALEADPGNIRALLVLGINDYYTPEIFGGRKKCADYLTQIIRTTGPEPEDDLDPTWGESDAYYYLIMYYLDRKEREKAIALYKEAHALYPDNARLSSMVSDK